MASLHAASFSLRFKRKDSTVFLFVDGSSTFGKIKQRLFAHVGAKDASELRLVSADLPAHTVFADEAMVSDFPLTDESVIYACVGGEEPPKAQ